MTRRRGRKYPPSSRSGKGRLAERDGRLAERDGRLGEQEAKTGGPSPGQGVGGGTGKETRRGITSRGGQLPHATQQRSPGPADSRAFLFLKEQAARQTTNLTPHERSDNVNRKTGLRKENMGSKLTAKSTSGTMQ